MTVLHVASECFPLAKTGGLADVVGALPLAQRALGVDARVLMPAYPGVPARLRGLREIVRLQRGAHLLTLLLGETEAGLPVYLVDCPALFERAGDPYRDSRGREFADNAERFALFCRVALALAGGADSDFLPRVMHLHDWQAGLAASWLRDAGLPLRVIYTIHNLAYQGQFDRAAFEALQLPDAWWTPARLEFWGRWSCMKAGIVDADVVTTVSPSYAQEIQTPIAGQGLDGVLRSRAADLHGIVNGIDPEVWNPQTDHFLTRRYGVKDAQVGKAANKYALQAELGLTPGDWPLVVFIGRLAEQKGADLILAAREALLELPAQYALLASGEEQLQQGLRNFAEQAPPGRVGLRLAHDESLAHRFNGAADVLLMPSRFEPCGLNQMYAQRYGALPVVRRTGGLIDTVVDATPATLADGSASGVHFRDADAGGLVYGVRRALDLIETAAQRDALRRAGMSRDFSWTASAQAYLRLYGLQDF